MPHLLNPLSIGLLFSVSGDIAGYFYSSYTNLRPGIFEMFLTPFRKPITKWLICLGLKILSLYKMDVKFYDSVLIYSFSENDFDNVRKLT